jgi:prolyl oligopeptidase
MSRPSRSSTTGPDVPVTDLVRYPLAPNARFWLPEYGDPKVEAEFRALYRLSPYHRLQSARKQVPAVLTRLQAGDATVDTMHSRKLTAELQTHRSKGPILLLAGSGGHQGAGARTKIEQFADDLTFLSAELGASEHRLPYPFR